MRKLVFVEEGPFSIRAAPLLEELSQELARRTGRDGKSSFSSFDPQHPRSVFLLALSDGEAVGCGALRPFDKDTCELKRMYAKVPSRGIGSQVLAALEGRARDFGYHAIFLETGRENEQAVGFYRKRGYRVRENYGRYAGRAECVCFEKAL